MTDIRAAIEIGRRFIADLSLTEAEAACLRTLCDFAEASLAEPTPPAAPEPPTDLVETVRRAILSNIITVGKGRRLGSHYGIIDIDVDAILAALAGRLVQPGMVAVPAEFLRGSGHNRDGESIMLVPRGHVAVPVEDLRLAITGDGTVARFNALLRLKERLRAEGGQP